MYIPLRKAYAASVVMLVRTTGAWTVRQAILRKRSALSVRHSSGLLCPTKTEYLLPEKSFADKDAIAGEWTELTLTDGRANFAIEPNRKAYIYLRVTDVSGNVQVINTEGVVVYTDAALIYIRQIHGKEQLSPHACRGRIHTPDDFLSDA